MQIIMLEMVVVKKITHLSYNISFSVSYILPIVHDTHLNKDSLMKKIHVSLALNVFDNV